MVLQTMTNTMNASVKRLYVTVWATRRTTFSGGRWRSSMVVELSICCTDSQWCCSGVMRGLRPSFSDFISLNLLMDTPTTRLMMDRLPTIINSTYNKPIYWLASRMGCWLMSTVFIVAIMVPDQFSMSAIWYSTQMPVTTLSKRRRSLVQMVDRFHAGTSTPRVEW